MSKSIIQMLVILLFALPAGSTSNTDQSYFAARRETLMSRIDGGVALVQGAADTRAYLQFRQNNDFYYLTGVEVPNSFLLLDAAQHRTLLFLPPRNRMQEVWEGPQLYPGAEARDLTGADEVLDVSKLEEELNKRKTSLKAIYIPFKPEETASTSRDRAALYENARERSPWDGRVSREKALEQNLKQKLGSSVTVKDLSPVLDGMRRVKDAQEIERMRESARIGAMGITEAIRATRPGVLEYQIAAVAEFIFKWNGAMGPAYFPIVGSGPNSCLLHYDKNTRRAESGDLVVLDFGPDYRYYHSDITRTFPVSGKFSDEQAKVYKVVLEAQKAAIAKIRPGATFGEFGSAAQEIIAKAGYSKYWLHGIGHYVGMSTHDVGEMRALEPGVVVTVEPGVYISEKNLGVRIEDTVLVTPDGCEVLSKSVPKEIPDIERLMAETSSITPK